MLNKGIEADHLLKKDGDITEAHLLTKLLRSIAILMFRYQEQEIYVMN